MTNVNIPLVFFKVRILTLQKPPVSVVLQEKIFKNLLFVYSLRGGEI